MDTRIESLLSSFQLLRSQVNPENCIGYWRITSPAHASGVSPALEDKDLLFRELRFGQALGLLVLLCFTHYCAST